MDETKKLGTEKLWKLLLKYSIPSIVGMLINAIYNIVEYFKFYRKKHLN